MKNNPLNLPKETLESSLVFKPCSYEQGFYLRDIILSLEKLFMSALELEVYEIFKNRFTEKEASKVIEYLEAKTEEKYLQKKDVLATKQDIAEAKADTIKWMFIFWIGQLAATAGILFALLNAYIKK